MRRLFVAPLAAAALLGAAVLPAAAHSPPPPHEHVVTTPSGEVVHIGPPVCSRPETHEGFHNFHTHVHTGTPGKVFATGDHPLSNITAVICP